MQKLKIGVVIVLIIFASQLKAQGKNDNYIYSIVVDNLMIKWNLDKIERNEIVFINKFKPNENYASEAINLIFDNDTIHKKNDPEFDSKFTNQFFYIAETIGTKEIYRRYDFDCDGNIINKNMEIRNAIENLKTNFYDTPYIRDVKFEFTRKYYLISDLRRKLLFISIFGDKIVKGWNRFYKKYPQSCGYFEFSKIEYYHSYACLYVEHSANGLFGSGNIIILNFNDNSWKIIAKINLWVS